MDMEGWGYLHSCHSMAGENKAGLALALLLLLMLPQLAFPSPPLLLTHHRLLLRPPLLIKNTLLCDDPRPGDSEEGLPLPAAGW